jgi:hypothetical protein
MLDGRFDPSTKLFPREILSLSLLPAQSEEIRAFAAIAMDRGAASEGHFSLSSASALRSNGLGRFSPVFIRH